MSQHDFDIANQTFPSFRSDLNDALQAAATISAGATAPTTPYAYQLWYDTANEKYMIRNAANSAWLNFVGIDTNGNVDVTGTVTADGLTVDGDLEISSASPEMYLMESDTTDVNTRIRTSAGDFRIETINDAKSSIVLRQRIDHATGDISFYEDTGTTAKFFWDASAESLGIGTTSPASDVGLSKIVEIEAATAGFKATATGGSSMEVYSASTASYVDTTTNHPIIFRPNKSERMRVSADGEVTKPYQPSFNVSKSSDQTLVVGVGTNTITWETEQWDVGGNFSSNTFTAPVTGKYYLETHLRIDSLDTAASYYLLKIITSNRTKQVIIDPNFSSDLSYYTISLGSVFDMDASDIAYVAIIQLTGTASHIDDSASYTAFSGYLLG